MNRFFNIRGDYSLQLAPWEAKELGLDWTIAWHELRKTLRMRSDIAGGVLVVYAGKISDLASTPRFTWSTFLKPDDPRIALGAWFHDELYHQHGEVTLECGKQVKLTRRQCDQILAFEAMPDLFAKRHEQHAVYQALQRFGKRFPNESILERFKW